MTCREARLGEEKNVSVGCCSEEGNAGAWGCPSLSPGLGGKREGAECRLSLQRNILSRTLQTLNSSLPDLSALVPREVWNLGSLEPKGPHDITATTTLMICEVTQHYLSWRGKGLGGRGTRRNWNCSDPRHREGYSGITFSQNRTISRYGVGDREARGQGIAFGDT